jgi:hypothetical protein
MRNNGSSEHNQNNNSKVIIITFSNFIRSSFYGINKREQILEFLNLKKLKIR